MKDKKILLIGFIFGLASLAISFMPGLDFSRWFFGFFFVYFFSGFPLGLILLPGSDSFLERALVSSGLSLLLTYPAGFFNVVWEGQSGQAIFGYHLTGDVFFLLLIYIVTYVAYEIHKN